MRTLLFWGCLSLAVYGLLFSGPVRAALQVSPVIISIPEGKKAATVIVENMSDETVTAQARVFDWNQEMGENKLDPSMRMQVSPPIFQLEPKQKQVVRLIIDGNLPPGQETTFRLFIDELPIAQGNGLIQLPIQFVLPVFVGTPMNARENIQWSVQKTTAGKLRLTAQNTGQKRVRIGQLKLRDEAGKVLADVSGLAGYVLAERFFIWDFPLFSAHKKVSAVKLSWQSEAESKNVRLPVHEAP